MKLAQPAKKHKTSQHWVYSCQYHVIFCPKYRRKVLIDGVDERLKELVAEKQGDCGYEVLDIEVIPDYVHLLLNMDLRVGIDIDTVVVRIKNYTASRLRKEFPWLKKRIPCLWTRNKFVSTVETVTLEAAKKYIEDQKGV